MTTNWTPVSEGPPKTNTNVLVTIKDDSGDSINYYTSVGWYYNGIWVVDNTVCYQVIAWMEFPKSYKEDKSKITARKIKCVLEYLTTMIG